MLLPEQLRFSFTKSTIESGRDPGLESIARELLRTAGAKPVAGLVRVEWNSRLRSCAGKASFRGALVWLNPRLREHDVLEIDRTLRHELAHLLAQYRAGRRRILPHGPEWRRACHDLGIGGERRCHDLPFPISRRERRFVYKCPNCSADFPRVRAIRHAVACLACCRKHNRGKFTSRFRLRLWKRNESPPRPAENMHDHATLLLQKLRISW
jgi:SprT protein